MISLILFGIVVVFFVTAVFGCYRFYRYGVKDTEMRWHEAIIKKREDSIQKLESSLNDWFGDNRSRAQFQHNEIHDLAIRMWDVMDMEP